MTTKKRVDANTALSQTKETVSKAHRCVYQVARIGHKYARYERLNGQHEQTAINGKTLSGLTQPVSSNSIKTAEITSGHTSKF